MGILVGLFTAKKSGAELKNDAKKELKNLRRAIKKNRRIINKEGPKFGSKLIETFETIKEKTMGIGDDVEELIKRS